MWDAPIGQDMQNHDLHIRLNKLDDIYPAPTPDQEIGYFLRCCTNVQTLDLHFDDTDQIESLLNHLFKIPPELQFRLVELKLNIWDDHIVELIESQPSIRKLVIQHMYWPDCKVFPLQSKTLPNLNTVCLPPSCLAGFISGRPVAHIGFMGEVGYFDSQAELDNQSEDTHMLIQAPPLYLSSQAILSLSFSPLTAGGLAFILDNIATMAPSLTVLSIQLCHGTSTVNDHHFWSLRHLQDLRCIRWHCAYHPTSRSLHLRDNHWCPSEYAGRSLRYVQFETNYDRKGQDICYPLEGHWEKVKTHGEPATSEEIPEFESLSYRWIIRKRVFRFPPLHFDLMVCVQVSHALFSHHILTSYHSGTPADLCRPHGMSMDKEQTPSRTSCWRGSEQTVLTCL